MAVCHNSPLTRFFFGKTSGQLFATFWLQSCWPGVLARCAGPVELQNSLARFVGPVRWPGSLAHPRPPPSSRTVDKALARSRPGATVSCV